MKYLLTGGGTGGHVYPALAIADELRRLHADAEFLYVGVRNRLESRVVPARGYALRYVRSRPYPRSFSAPSQLLFWLTLATGVSRALLILLRFQPHVIITTGGFVSAPVMLAFGILRKLGVGKARMFLYEPNARPGLLNHTVGRFADRIGVAFEQAGRWFDIGRVAVVGYPVRRELLQLDRMAARHRLGIDPERQVLFVVGGSQGAREINRAVVEALPRLRKRSDLFILHVTGATPPQGPSEETYDPVSDTEQRLRESGLAGDTSDWYRRLPYAEQIEDLYAASDVVVCRGGAATLTEIGVCGLPAVIIPLSTSADDHQAINAREMEKRGAAVVLYPEATWEDGAVTTRVHGHPLAAAIERLLEAPEERRRVSAAAQGVPRRDSLELIRRELESMVEGGRPAPLNLEAPGDERLPSDPNGLVRKVRDRVEAAGGIQGIPDRELAYLRYQADRLLASREWYEIPLGKRNVGIKLAGYLEQRDRLDLLLRILQDRRQVGALKRLLGGDFRHSGILRRNTIQIALRWLRVAREPKVEAALLFALETDPYFEVRAAAADLLGEEGKPSDRIEGALVNALSDRSRRVVARAIRALGAVGQDSGLIRLLRSFYHHPDWQVRHEVVLALQNLLRRGVLGPAEMAGEAERVLATSPNFTPEFPLKESLAELAELAGPGEDEREAADAAGAGGG